MKKNTGTEAFGPRHIDTLRVVYGHVLPIASIDSIKLGERARDERDDASPYLLLPAGRGE